MIDHYLTGTAQKEDDMNALIRCDALPKQVQDDLTLVLFWCEHYGSQEEQDAVERLVDYFAEPFEEPDHYPHLDPVLDEMERMAEAEARIAELIEANTACTLHIASQDERINRFVELVDQLERQLAEQPAMTDEVRNVILAALTEYEDARNKFWDGHPDAMRDRDEARAAIAYLDVQPKGDG